MATLTKTRTKELVGPCVTIQASSVGEPALSLLQKCRGGFGRVQGMFGTTINIDLGGGLISLVTEMGERGPLNVKLPLSAGELQASCRGLDVGDVVKVGRNALELGSQYQVSLRSAEVYSPELGLQVPVIATADIRANMAVVARAGLLSGNLCGLGQLLCLPLDTTNRDDGWIPGGELNIFARAALPAIVKLMSAITEQGDEVKEVREALRLLIGLGPGLTPSADDMLAGLALFSGLYWINTRKAERPSRLIAKGIRAEVSGRTTRLSEEFLKQAAFVKGNESVLGLCSALLTKGTATVERESKRVLGIGETSGTDIVLGVILGGLACMGGSLRKAEGEASMGR